MRKRFPGFDRHLPKIDGAAEFGHSGLDKIIFTLESNRKYINVNPKCELQLGKRGLYNLVGGENLGKTFQLALLWVLNFSDGTHSLLDISKESAIDFEIISLAAGKLFEQNLLTEA